MTNYHPATGTHPPPFSELPKAFTLLLASTRFKVKDRALVGAAGLVFIRSILGYLSNAPHIRPCPSGWNDEISIYRRAT